LKIRLLLCASILALAIFLIGTPANAQGLTVFGGYSFATNNLQNDDPGLHGYALSAAYNINRYIGIEANVSGHNGSPTLFSDTPTSTETGDNEVANEDIYTYVFGPKFTLPVGNFSLFAHVLVGASTVHAGVRDTCIPATGSGEVETCSSDDSDSFRLTGSGMAVKTGGGVDWNHGHWGIRILELDYVHSQVFLNETATCTDGCEASSFDGSFSGVELSTGVVFNFGRR
jgi:hypothetical protein